jgi:short-subunit dehydrogenase
MPKTILITGSSSGLGRELAIKLSEDGNKIITHGRNASELSNLKKQIEQKGISNPIIVGDLSSQQTLTSLINEAKKFDLDILINNAGQYLNKEFFNCAEEEINNILNINFFSHIKLIKGILPHFLNKKKGLIININSIAGLQGSKGEALYSASKHALKGFSESLKLEVTSKGIIIMDVYLGAMATKMAAGRKNPELCIQPKEAASVISRLCETYDSLYVSEIKLLRRKYDVKD